MHKILMPALAVALVTTGCATKRYGRVQPLSGVEKVAYTCRDIEIEVAKVEAFQQQVAEGAKFNVASVLGFLGDYGIGNSMERGGADRSALRRLNELKSLRAERGCTGSSLTTTDLSGARGFVQQLGTSSMSPDPSDPPGTIWTGRVKLIPADTLSGYCIKAPAGYLGTGAIQTPIATAARPRCR